MIIMSDAGSAPRRPPPACVCFKNDGHILNLYLNIAHAAFGSGAGRQRVLRLIHSISPAAEFPVDSCVLLIEADVRRSGHVPGRSASAFMAGH